MNDEIHVKKLIQKKIGEVAEHVDHGQAKQEAETLLLLAQALATVGDAKYADPNSGGKSSGRGSAIIA